MHIYIYIYTHTDTHTHTHIHTIDILTYKVHALENHMHKSNLRCLRWRRLSHLPLSSSTILPGVPTTTSTPASSACWRGSTAAAIHMYQYLWVLNDSGTQRPKVQGLIRDSKTQGPRPDSLVHSTSMTLPDDHIFAQALSQSHCAWC
jgi:hypothetical protein